MQITISKDIPIFEILLGEQKYTLAFPLTSVVKAEEKTGLRLRYFADWIKIEPQHFSAILECGLEKFHPDVAHDIAIFIANLLSAEQLDELHRGLCMLNFPKAMAKLEELQKEQKDSDPNAQSGANPGN